MSSCTKNDDQTTNFWLENTKAEFESIHTQSDLIGIPFGYVKNSNDFRAEFNGQIENINTATLYYRENFFFIDGEAELFSNGEGAFGLLGSSLPTISATQRGASTLSGRDDEVLEPERRFEVPTARPSQPLIPTGQANSPLRSVASLQRVALAPQSVDPAAVEAIDDGRGLQATSSTLRRVTISDQRLATAWGPKAAPSALPILLHRLQHHATMSYLHHIGLVDSLEGIEGEGKAVYERVANQIARVKGVIYDPPPEGHTLSTNTSWLRQAHEKKRNVVMLSSLRDGFRASDMLRSHPHRGVPARSQSSAFGLELEAMSRMYTLNPGSKLLFDLSASGQFVYMMTATWREGPSVDFDTTLTYNPEKLIRTLEARGFLIKEDRY